MFRQDESHTLVNNMHKTAKTSIPAEKKPEKQADCVLEEESCIKRLDMQPYCLK